MRVDDRLSLLALAEGEPVVRSATVVQRDQHTVHVAMDDLVPLPVGNVVALLHVGTPSSEASLAVVSESLGTAITALRLLERRR